VVKLIKKDKVIDLDEYEEHIKQLQIGDDYYE
jgi:hypothetical protein